MYSLWGGERRPSQPGGVLLSANVQKRKEKKNAPRCSEEKETQEMSEPMNSFHLDECFLETDGRKAETDEEFEGLKGVRWSG